MHKGVIICQTRTLKSSHLLLVKPSLTNANGILPWWSKCEFRIQNSGFILTFRPSVLCPSVTICLPFSKRKSNLFRVQRSKAFKSDILEQNVKSLKLCGLFSYANSSSFYTIRSKGHRQACLKCDIHCSHLSILNIGSSRVLACTNNGPFL